MLKESDCRENVLQILGDLFGRVTVFYFDEKRRNFAFIADDLILHRVERNFDTRSGGGFVSSDDCKIAFIHIQFIADFQFFLHLKSRVNYCFVRFRIKSATFFDLYSDDFGILFKIYAVNQTASRTCRIFIAACFDRVLTERNDRLNAFDFGNFRLFGNGKRNELELIILAPEPLKIISAPTFPSRVARSRNEPSAIPLVKIISKMPMAMPKTLTIVRAGRCIIFEKTRLSINYGDGNFLKRKPDLPIIK